MSDTHEVAGSSPAMPTKTKRFMIETYKNENKTAVIEAAAELKEIPVYVEVSSEAGHAMYAITEPVVDKIGNHIVQTAKPFLENDGDVKVGIGFVYNGKERVIVKAVLTMEQFNEAAKKNINALFAITKGVINQLFRFTLNRCVAVNKDFLESETENAESTGTDGTSEDGGSESTETPSNVE